MHHWVAALGALVAVAVVCPLPAHAELSAVDKRMLAEMALQWAADGGIPDVKLAQDASNLIVAELNLPKDVKLQVPGRTVTVVSRLKIQARADLQGDFLFFQFGRFSSKDDHASVSISLLWAISVQSTQQYLSGGGAQLEFEKRDGKWQLLPVTERWMS